MRRYVHISLPAGGLAILALFVAACSAALAFSSPELELAADPPRPRPLPTARPTRLPRTQGPGVAEVLAKRPPAGELVEVDAYFAGAGVAPHESGPRPPGLQADCPINWETGLTDRPFLGTLSILDGVHSNVLPNDAPWLVAAAPEAVRPGVHATPELPYHARLRGYLGDPAFAHCPNPERVFVVMEVVRVYEPLAQALQHELPADYASWPRYREPHLGYSVPYPPGWRVEAPGGTTLALRSPRWPDYPVAVCAHQGETYYTAQGTTPELAEGYVWGTYQQGQAFGAAAGGQGLAGYQVDRCQLPGERTVAVLLNAHGRTYELALRYPLGLDAPQQLLTAYTAIVEGFRAGE